MSIRNDLMAMNCVTVEQVSQFRNAVLIAVGDLEQQLAVVTKERNEAIAENLENCRIIGMGAERELALMAKLEEEQKRIKASQQQTPCAWIVSVSGEYSHIRDTDPALREDEEEDSQSEINYFPLYQAPVISREPELKAEIERLNDALDAKITICGDEKVRSLIAEVDELTRKLEEQQAVIAQKNNALEAAMIVCDAVPNQAHKVIDVRPLQHLGILVNQDDGCHGIYAIVRDALAMTVGTEELNKLLSEAKKQASCTVEFIPKIVSENLGKISDSQAEKIVEMEAQIESLKQRLFKAETERGVMFEEYDKLQARDSVCDSGESAFLCKNCDAIYWESVSACDCQIGVKQEWIEVKVIRNLKGTK